MGQNDLNISLKALKMINSIVVKYDYSARSDPLYAEIILVCNDLHDTFLSYS